MISFFVIPAGQRLCLRELYAGTVDAGGQHVPLPADPGVRLLRSW